jgi:hypothetical protein
VDAAGAFHREFQMNQHLFNAVRLFLTAGLIVALQGGVLAQSRDRDKDRERKEEPSPRELETRVSRAEEALLEEYMEVASEYYKQGDKEGSLAVLRRVEHLNPKLEGLKQKITLIEEELLQENGLKIELDVAHGWTPVCEVEKGGAFRIAATGEYKLEYEATVPVTGLASSDPAKDHIKTGAFGALIGVIVTAGKPGEAFAINTGAELNPDESGQLFLRVNVPAAAKCKGELKIQLSGAIKPVPRKKAE